MPSNISFDIDISVHLCAWQSHARAHGIATRARVDYLPRGYTIGKHAPGAAQGPPGLLKGPFWAKTGPFGGLRSAVVVS